jgi:N6-adenosine-specific RNA methylase IME4
MNTTFPDKKYNVIYADPPWSYGDKGFGKRPNGAVSGSFAPEAGRYPTMSMEAMCQLPVKNIASNNCVCLMWATSPLLPEALTLMSAWGFKFKTIAFVWSKITNTGKEVANLGQYTMGNVEIVLLGTRGSVPRQARNVRQFLSAERTRHSAKPMEIRNRIEHLFGDVPRIELFARTASPGWDVWGNEV